MSKVALASLAWALAFFPFRTGEARGGKILHESWEKTYEVSANLILNIRNGDGRIYIYGSEGNELKVTATKRAFTKERLDVISIEVAIDGETATIETKILPVPEGGGLTQDRSGTVDYTIIVPQTCAVARAELENGEVLLEGLRGPSLNASLGMGRLLAINCFSPTRLSVGRGGMDLSFAWWEEQPFSLRAEIADGDLRVGVPSEAALKINAVATKGRTVNPFTSSESATAEFHLRAATGNIRIEKSD